VHASTDVLLDTFPYVFTGHASHAACPVAFLNVPAAHPAHSSPSTPATIDVHPALHLQSSRESLPGADSVFGMQLAQSLWNSTAVRGENVSRGQAVQLIAPNCGLNLPGGQNTHVPPFGPV
jgi:hypothetical protein